LLQRYLDFSFANHKKIKMDLKLNNKVAVITGASKGIGAGIAKAFAREGAKVVVNYASSKEDADQVVDEITKNGGTAIAVKCDIKLSGEIERMFQETKDAFGGLDILVNNAGVFMYELLGNVTEESFHLQYNTHVLGNLMCTQRAVEMFEDKGGCIINLSSTVSQNPYPGLIVYSAAKAAIDNMTKTLAKELGPKKIRINTLAPGVTQTEGNLRMGITGSDMEKQMVSMTPLGRPAQVEDIAKVAIFLASEDAGWVTGERITAGGGLL
jgi:3-oxoacyl-[acyl-carrier protein] reductase